MAKLSPRGSSAVARAFRTRMTILWRLTLALWALELVDTLLLASSLDRYGIRPRGHRAAARGTAASPSA